MEAPSMCWVGTAQLSIAAEVPTTFELHQNY
jgi:hypothetical protein